MVGWEPSTGAVKLYQNNYCHAQYITGHMWGESDLETFFVPSQQHLKRPKTTYKGHLPDFGNVLFPQTSDSLSICSGLETRPGLVDLFVSVTSDENIAVCYLICGEAPPSFFNSIWYCTVAHLYSLFVDFLDIHYMLIVLLEIYTESPTFQHLPPGSQTTYNIVQQTLECVCLNLNFDNGGINLSGASSSQV